MSASCSVAKQWHGTAPPTELQKNSSYLQLLSQGAEARVWLVTLNDSSTNSSDAVSTDGSSDEKTANPGGDSNGRKGTIHVGSGIHVPKINTLSQKPSPLKPNAVSPSSSTPQKIQVICKERFPKKYRHPQLDVSLTKSRTKAEARCLMRCQKANIPCPNVLAIAHWSNCIESKSEGAESDPNGNKDTRGVKESSCLFLEYIDGCTVRNYFEHRSAEEKAEGIIKNSEIVEPSQKRPRNEISSDIATERKIGGDDLERAGKSLEERHTTVIDEQTIKVAYSLGTLVGKIHAAGIIHGDLTTSNVMLRNPPWACNSGDKNRLESNQSKSVWTPQLALIDFGLATSTASTLKPNPQQQKKTNKQHHNAEEKAVDLYVLERAFLSTHPESEPLVEEVLKGYCEYFQSLDRNGQKGDIADTNTCKTISGDADMDEPTNNGISSESNKEKEANDGDGMNLDGPSDTENAKSEERANNSKNSSDEIGPHGSVARSVLKRLDIVRMRGRKRECFG